MINLKLIKKEVDVSAILKEINENEELWGINIGRQKSIPVQQNTQNISIRDAYKLDPNENAMNTHFTKWTNLGKRMPVTKQWLEDYCEDNLAELGRAMLVRLRGSSEVYPHIDSGDYYKIRERLHLVLQSKEGSILHANEDTAVMQTGEIWRLNNKAVHSAVNKSDDWRIHLIFDTVTQHSRAISYSILSQAYDKILIDKDEINTLLSKALSNQFKCIWNAENTSENVIELKSTNIITEENNVNDWRINNYFERESAVQEFNNAFLCGQSFMALTKEGELIAETGTNPKYFDHFVNTEVLYSYPKVTVAGKAALISKQNSSNYWQWFQEVLLSVFLVKKKYPNENIKFLMPTKIHTWQMETLQLLGIQKEDIIGIKDPVYEIENLIIPSTLQAERTLKNINTEFLELFVHLKQKMLENDKPLPDKKIYIARYDLNKNSYIGNEKLLVDELVNAGFQILNMQKLNIYDIAKHVLDAELVIGSTGTGMLAGALAKDNAKIIEIFRETDFKKSAHQYSVLNRRKGNRHFSYIVHDKPSSREWTINIENFMQNLKEII